MGKLTLNQFKFEQLNDKEYMVSYKPSNIIGRTYTAIIKSDNVVLNKIINNKKISIIQNDLLALRYEIRHNQK